MILLSLPHTIKRARLGRPYVDESWYRREARYIWPDCYVRIVCHGLKVDLSQGSVDMNEVVFFINEIGARIENIEIAIDPDYDLDSTENPWLVMYIYHPSVPWRLAQSGIKT